jgi:hypothetical protein
LSIHDNTLFNQNCRDKDLNSPEEPDSDEEMQLSFWQLLKSTLSAFVGVQSNANRERDFKHGKVSHFIWMALLFGLVFVLTLLGVVQLVMHLTSN